MACSPLRRAVTALAVVALLAGCGGDDSDAEDPTGEEPGVEDPSDDEPRGDDAAGEHGPDPAGGPPALATTVDDCPPGFDGERLGAGYHEDFASADQARAFHLLLPDSPDGPRPLFVALTGTVQAEQAFLAQSRLDELPAAGWIVVAPERNDNGLLWPPWDAMRTPAQADLPNPDATFVDDLVHCVAAHHAVDATRVFVGGISIGGTMTNLLLRQHSELFTGGIVASGNFNLTAPAEPTPLDEMVVIVAWGGDADRWIGCPDGRMGPELAGEPGCVDVSFVEDASAASVFYDAESSVRQVACVADVGHIWIAAGTAYMAEILAAHPRGSTGPVELPPDPPEELTCTPEAFVR